MSTININVKHLNHDTHKISILLTATVDDLKTELEKLSKVKASELKLIFRGKVLKNGNETLENIKAEEGSTLHMIHTAPKPETTQTNSQS